MQEQSQEFVPSSPDHMLARKNFIEREKNELIKEGLTEGEALAKAETRWEEGAEKTIKKAYIETPETGEVLRKETFEKIEKERQEKGADKERYSGDN